MSAKLQPRSHEAHEGRFVQELCVLRVFVVVFLVIIASASSALAGERYALIITGASGGPQFAKKYDAWRVSFITTLRSTFDYPADHVLVLAEEEGAGVKRATRDNVRAALADLRRRAAKDDVVLVLLIGHGTVADREDAKFNLVGPDLTADEWVDLVKPIAGRLVFVNTTSGSFPFIHKLSGRNRIVLTANDSAAQQFETVFPDYFLKAFGDPAADLDKNGKVSIWEAFSYASAGVRGWFEARGQLATERPLLDDTGNGAGREANTPGPDGPVAQVTYLQPEAVIPATGDAELASLLRRRAELESDLELIRARKPTLAPDEYELTLEKLLLELARLDRQIRSKT